MNFKFESANTENTETPIIETYIQEPQIENVEGREVSINDYFDDGFGDELPNQVSLESEEDITAFERAYNIDFKSYLERRDMAA